MDLISSPLPTGGGCSVTQQKHSQLGLMTMPNLNEILKYYPSLYNAKVAALMTAYYLKFSSNITLLVCKLLRV